MHSCRWYDTLRRIARQQLARERPGHTLSATALAHEAYARLIGLTRIEWRDRAHFFAAAAGAMRRVLIDYAVARKARKRGAVRRSRWTWRAWSRMTGLKTSCPFTRRSSGWSACTRARRASSSAASSPG